jgi:hypothetical protein
MQVVYLKTKKLFLLMDYCTSIKKNGKLEYFISGEGRKQTQAFTILNDVLPSTWDMNWMQICEITNAYGIHVGVKYASNKVAGIVAKQELLGYMHIYSKVKDFIDENFGGEFDPTFFDKMKCAYMPAIAGTFFFDIARTDDVFAREDRDYNNKECTYKGVKNISMSDYIKLTYGTGYEELIDLAMQDIEEEQEAFVDPNQMELFPS